MPKRQKSDAEIESKTDTKPEGQMIGRSDNPMLSNMPSEEMPDNLESEMPAVPMPISQPEPVRRTRLEDEIQVTFLLLNKASIRQCVEKGFSKSLVEKISRTLRRKGLITKAGAPTHFSRAKAKYDELPYEHEIERTEPSSWVVQMARDSLFMDQIAEMQDRRARIKQMQTHPNQSSVVDWTQVLTAAALAGTGNKNGQSNLIETVKALKDMGVLQQQDVFQTLSQIEQLKDGAVQKHAALEQQMYQRAKAEGDIGIVKQIIDKGADAISKALPALQKRNVPAPNNPAIPPPAQISSVPSTLELLPNEKTALENLSLPMESMHVIEQKPQGEPFGYSNLEKFAKDRAGER